MKKIIYLFALMPILAFGQLNTDRPSYFPSPLILDNNRLMVEAGYTNADAPPLENVWAIPNLTAKLALSPEIEIGLNANFLMYEIQTFDVTERQVTFQGKYMFYNADGAKITAMGQLGGNFGDGEGTILNLIGAATKKMVGIDFTLNVGFFNTIDGDDDRTFYNKTISIKGAKDFAKHFQFFLEPILLFTKDNSAVAFQTGLLYEIVPNFQADLGAFYSFDENDSRIFVGLAYNFDIK